jgi:hypothetical protein
MVDATRLLIKNGMLIDGSGGEPVPNKLLVVEGNRITLVGEADGSMRPETPEDRLIDATGKFILPGLIDAPGSACRGDGPLTGDDRAPGDAARSPGRWFVGHAIPRPLRAARNSRAASIAASLSSSSPVAKNLSRAASHLRRAVSRQLCRGMSSLYCCYSQCPRKVEMSPRVQS